MLPAYGTEGSRAADAALSCIDDAYVLQLITSLVDIPSPTGEEQQLAGKIGDEMSSIGLEVQFDPIGESSASVIGRVGAEHGMSCLFFSPLDTPFSDDPFEEIPWMGSEFHSDLLPKAQLQGHRVIGLGANNPKGHITAILAAARAVCASGGPLAGRLALAFGAGGAPCIRSAKTGFSDFGHGAGCLRLLRQGLNADFAVVVKPGFAVSWEEAGLAWFRVRVHGVHTYVGHRNLAQGANAVVRAAAVIQTLERWLEEYTRRHTKGLVSPMGAVSAVRAGWTNKLAFLPAACDLYLDIRLNPFCSPEQLRQELEALLDSERSRGVRIDCELLHEISGAATEPENWIVRSCVAAWEAVESRPHEPRRNTSGQTEAVLFRQHGIPTARIGLPGVSAQDEQGGERYTMGIVDLWDIRRLTECLVRVMVDTCTRRPEEETTFLAARVRDA